MSGKKTIRIIKKDERNRPQKSVQRMPSPRDAARDMVQTVTNWVNELQQKRRSETASAIKSLMSETPRPSEA